MSSQLEWLTMSGMANYEWPVCVANLEWLTMHSVANYEWPVCMANYEQPVGAANYAWHGQLRVVSSHSQHLKHFFSCPNTELVKK